MSKYDDTTSIAVILIAGKAGAGKSTTGKLIRQIVGTHSTACSFATPLKEMAANVLGVDVKQFDDYDFKNTHRPLLIALADSYKAVHGEDIFARKNVQTILNLLDSAFCGIVVADDTRYLYEYEAMTNRFRNVLLLEVVSPEHEQTNINHHSEDTDWVSAKANLRLENNSTIDALRDKLKLLLPQFGIAVLRDEVIQKLPQS